MTATVLRGVQLPDGTRTDLVMADGLFVDSPSGEATVVDCDGLIALPGLVDVHTHLRDPALSVDGIARALNCSRRHLYNAFTGEGESLAGHIQRLRLEACVRTRKSRHKRCRCSSRKTRARL